MVKHDGAADQEQDQCPLSHIYCLNKQYSAKVKPKEAPPLAFGGFARSSSLKSKTVSPALGIHRREWVACRLVALLKGVIRECTPMHGNPR